MKSQHGGVWRMLHYRDELKRYVVRQMEEVVLPADTRALALLEDMLADRALTPDQRECLEVQRREIGIHRCYMERVRNWFQASFHRSAGSTPYAGLPALASWTSPASASCARTATTRRSGWTCANFRTLSTWA